MKTAVIGSRNLKVRNLKNYLPNGTDEIVSGGAKGIDRCAREFANENKIKLTEFFPEYEKHGRAAPIIRNDKIIDYSDIVIAFWDGKSAGTKYVIEKCRKQNKKVIIYMPK